MLYKFRCPRTSGTNEWTPLINELVSLRHLCKRSKQAFPVQSPGLQSIPIRNVVNEMDIGHFLISIAGHPYSRQKWKHDECRQLELL
ncbi:hypothetical protein TNCV_3438851 [Trichonephila clavipes]|nr:hypothetical protein TNCV_3438851 [Trichonephila clavipes]